MNLRSPGRPANPTPTLDNAQLDHASAFHTDMAQGVDVASAHRWIHSGADHADAYDAYAWVARTQGARRMELTKHTRLRAARETRSLLDRGHVRPRARAHHSALDQVLFGGSRIHLHAHLHVARACGVPREAALGGRLELAHVDLLLDREKPRDDCTRSAARELSRGAVWVWAARRLLTLVASTVKQGAMAVGPTRAVSSLGGGFESGQWARTREAADDVERHEARVVEVDLDGGS